MIGAGSNVVDRFHRVKAVPAAGFKGYFANLNELEEATVVGGVTLNHLAWASLLGVPTALIALQGEDDAGKFIRKTMNELGVSTELVRVSNKYTTSVSLIFLQPNGERAIIMAPAATSLIDDALVREHWSPAVSTAKIVTTEISQLPLSAVEQLLTDARRGGALSCVDVDVPPSVAVTEAGLGDIKQLRKVLGLASVLKPTKESAVELLQLFGDADAKLLSLLSPLPVVASAVRRTFGSALVALTDGVRGAALASAEHQACLGVCWRS